MVCLQRFLYTKRVYLHNGAICIGILNKHGDFHGFSLRCSSKTNAAAAQKRGSNSKNLVFFFVGERGFPYTSRHYPGDTVDVQNQKDG